MPRITKLLAPLALAAGVALVWTAGADGQPPFGKGQPPFGKGFPQKGGDDRKGDGKKGEEKKVEGKKGEEKKGPPPRPDAVVDAWVKVLIEKITDPHDTVRDSARGALVSVGPAAVPALQALADGNDPAKAVAARKVIGAIHGHREPQGPPPGRPAFAGPGFPGGMGRGFPGGPGMGPMGRPGGERGPGGPGVGPMGRPGGDREPEPKREPGRDRGPDPKRGGREARDVEVAPMPRAR